MNLLKSSNSVIKGAIKCMNNYLKANSRINNLDGDYELEFYLNNSFKNSFKVSGSEEVISRCLTVYEKFLSDNINKENFDSFEKALENPKSIRVLYSPSGVVCVELILKIASSDSSHDEIYTLKIDVYEKERLKNEVCDYISSKELDGEQKEYILDMFEENNVYSKNLDCILETLKEEIITLIPEWNLKDLIKDGGYTIIDVINNDFSKDILNLMDKNNEIYRIYKDVISVKKIEDGYAITFCDDIIHKIEYKIELCI